MNRTAHVSLWLFAPLLLNAQAGTLDVTFDGDGTVELPVPGFNVLEVHGKTVHSLPGGGTIVCGTLRDSTYMHYMFTTQLLDDGSLDMTYGQGGHAVFDLTPFGERLLEAHLRPDDRILLVGGADPGGLPLLFQITAAGVPDSSFGLNGLVQFPYNIRYVSVGVMDTMGRYTAAAFDSTYSYPQLLRLTPNGVLDTTFGAGTGLVQLPAPCGDHYYTDATLLTDGRLAFIRTHLPCSPNYTWGGVRIFNGDGSVSANASITGIGNIQLKAVGKRSNGGFVVSGWDGQGWWERKANWFDADTLTATYDYTYITISGTQYYLSNTVRDGIMDESDRLIQVGDILTRTFADGSLDPSFNGTGVTELPYLGQRLELQSDGKILVLCTPDFMGPTHILRFNGDLLTTNGAEPSLDETLRVFPNPTLGSVHLTVSLSGHSHQAFVVVHNMRGAEVLHRSVKTGIAELDFSGLPNGVYNIGLRTGDGTRRDARVMKID